MEERGRVIRRKYNREREKDYRGCRETYREQIKTNKEGRREGESDWKS